MTRRGGAGALLVMLGAVLTADVFTQSPERSAIPENYTWNLADVFPDIGAWRSAKDAFEKEAPSIGAFKGKLGESAAPLADAFELRSRLEQRLVRLGVYASMLGDQDTRIALHQGMGQEIQQLGAKFAAEAAYMEPEILRIDPGRLDQFMAQEPRLRPYAFYLRDIRRRAEHTLSDAEEKILAAVGPLAESPGEIYGILSNADFPYPTITLSNGQQAKVDQSGLGALRASANREDREKAMAAFFTALGAFSNTFGTTMSGDVQKMLFYSRTRKYGSSLEAALNGPNIPVSVYMRLVDGVNRHLPTFHRYLRLRKRMLNVPELHYYDLYAPLVSSVNRQYTPEEAQAQVLSALAPLGDDYVGVVNRSFRERWIDLMPNEGKRSGAYSQGAVYDTHPYMLLNYLGKYDDVSTLAHELGHTMQSYYSNRTQPYPTAGYETFVAEVASTFNEELLLEHTLRQIKDTPTRLSVLGNYLENIKGTVFRQTQFAEFELRMHEAAEKGQALTGEMLANMYLDITKRYYGHEQGISVVDDYVAHEWSYIPHFYRDFYVFQYATSFTASTALAEKVLAGDQHARDRYLTFLGAGGSKYPIELLKDAGVDMTTDEPLALTIKKMNRVMDEMETLLQ
jgi:oligoendopeptidase F